MGVRSVLQVSHIFSFQQCESGSTGLAVMLSHSGFAVLGSVAGVAFASVFACVFVDDHSVSAHVIAVAFSCLAAMAVAGFIHEFQRLDAVHNFS